MWKILLTFVSIGFVTASNYDCLGFSNYQHDVNLIDELNGEYLVVYSSCSYIVGCERIKWTVWPNNTRTAEVKDADGCCRRINNLDGSNNNYIEYDVTPVSTCTHLPSTVRVGHKMVGAVGTGQDRCYIVLLCQPYRNGLLVLCRSEPTLLIWVLIHQLLATVLRLVGLPVPYLQSVNQSNCALFNTCYV